MKHSANRSQARGGLLGAILLSALLTALPVAAQTTHSEPRNGAATPGSGGYGSGSSGMIASVSRGMSGAMPSMSQPANTGMKFNGGGASPNANGMAPNPNGMRTTGGKPAKPVNAAHLLKKIKPAYAAAALPNQYTGYNWGGSSIDASSLYAPTWSAPQLDYTWGATPP